MQEWHRAICAPTGSSNERETIAFLGEPGDNPKLAEIAKAHALSRFGWREAYVWTISRAPDLGGPPEVTRAREVQAGGPSQTLSVPAPIPVATPVAAPVADETMTVAGLLSVMADVSEKLDAIHKSLIEVATRLAAK